MRFICIILLTIILITSLSGCKNDLSKDETNIKKVNNSKNTAVYTTSVMTVPQITKPTNTPISDLSSSNNEKKEVIIKTSYEKPLSLNDKNTILLEWIIEWEEYIEIIIKGEILNFEQVELSWDESINSLKEKEVIKRIKKLKDQIIVIKTYQPEGIPSEKIKWKSRDGKTYEYIISERSLNDIDNSVSKFKIY